VELKFGKQIVEVCKHFAFNRTIVELKYETFEIAEIEGDSFNRTIVELKSQTATLVSFGLLLLTEP